MCMMCTSIMHDIVLNTSTANIKHVGIERDSPVHVYHVEIM